VLPNNRAKNRRAVNQVKLAENIWYDVDKYVEILISAAETLLFPFDYSREKIHDLVVRGKFS